VTPPKAPAPKPPPKAPTRPIDLGSNLVKSGNFEKVKKNNKLPQGWYTTSKKDIVYELVAPAGGSGKCMKLQATNPQRFGRFGHNILLEPNTRYRLSARIKTVAVALQKPRGKGASVLIRPKEGKGGAIAALPAVKGDTDWTEKSVDFKTPADVEDFTILLTVGVDANATGTAFFDDVKIQRIQ